VSRDDRLIEANVRRYRRRTRRYEALHGEIFNPVEQERLRDALEDALGRLDPVPAGAPRALDLGCGSGNLTSHLLDLGAHVTAADVSPDFLALVSARFADTQRLETHRLDGRSLDGIASGAYDLVATYSVLHHVPDYLATVREACRVIRPGGVLYIDHEASPNVWGDDPVLARFREEVLATEHARPRSLRRFLDPGHYPPFIRHHHVQLRRRLGDPRYEPEGDIHVWPDDHVEWDRVEGTVRQAGFEVLRSEDYLLYRSGTPPELYERYRGETSDSRVLVARRRTMSRSSEGTSPATTAPST
jgi:SAM-dependent methyltransferase